MDPTPNIVLEKLVPVIRWRCQQDKARFHVEDDLLSLHGYQPQGELGERF